MAAEDTERLLGGILEAINTLKGQQKALVDSNLQLQLEVTKVKITVAIATFLGSTLVSAVVAIAIRAIMG